MAPQKGELMTRSTRDSTADAGESSIDQAAEQVRESARTAQDKATTAVDQARARLREQIDQRSSQAGEQVHATAKDVRGIAEQLRGQGKDWPARLADQMADRVESFGSYLHDADADRMLRDTERFARRQPWAMVAGGLALGFAVSRFLKASSGRRYQAGHEGPAAYGQHTEAPYTPVENAPPVAGTADVMPGRRP
jgi:ElaB/YqjD/DUF883 family membrane-anchored ribosome-binding protein